MTKNLIIIGGSYAACELATAARQNGFDDDITILSDESYPPYHRPPLSKAYLNDPDSSALPLKGEQHYKKNRIQLHLDARVDGIDPQARSVITSAGHHYSFCTLALTVGARARSLSIPGSDLRNILYLRSLADANVVRSVSESASEIVVIGGGFIGLEVASALVQRGKRVTIIEATDHILNRVVCPATSAFITSTHLRRGSHIITNGKVNSFNGESGFVKSVSLDDGRSIYADMVVVGVGSVPNCELAEALAVDCHNGILVDKHCRTSHSSVFAAGDCTFYAGPFTPMGARLECVQNAMDQARIAGASVAGKEKAYEALPWFWSDQYNLKLQIAGLSSGADDIEIKQYSDSELSVFYFKNSSLIAVDSINRPRDHMAARRVLQSRPPSREALVNVYFQPAELLKH